MYNLKDREEREGRGNREELRRLWEEERKRERERERKEKGKLSYIQDRR